MALSRVYLSPGFFGFKRIGSFDYFQHLEGGLRRRFGDAGRPVEVRVVDNHPTASIRRRAGQLTSAIEETCGDGGAIHLLGHSTGGLDARLVASPTAVTEGAGPPRWGARIRSVTTVNCPHYGTPLAALFATLSGQRLLSALSAITVMGLKLGAPPLAITSSLVAALRRIDDAMYFRLSLIDGLTDRAIRVLDDASSAELSSWIRLLRDDQGALIQLSPEAMDLFQAGVEDRAGVRYQCTASYAPVPGPREWLGTVVSPWGALSMAIYTMLLHLSVRESEKYPCASPRRADEDALARALGGAPPPSSSDGIVPVRSQVWGAVVWAGLGDHLDVVGHFDGGRRDRAHHDWLNSGSRFDRARFDALLDAVVAGMLAAEQA